LFAATLRCRLSKGAGLLVEGERVVARHHAEVERERALRGRVEVLYVRAHVVEPPGVGLAEPAAQRSVVQAVARHVRVFEHGLHVLLGQALRVVLDARLRAQVSPARRVVRGYAHAPTLEVARRVRLAREGQRDRAEL